MRRNWQKSPGPQIQLSFSGFSGEEGQETREASIRPAQGHYQQQQQPEHWQQQYTPFMVLVYGPLG